jgi:hypothetical protein
MRELRISPGARFGPALCCAALCAAALACKSPPPPDPDGEPGQAMLLETNTPTTDQLFCRNGDCADWYRFQVTGRGELRVELVAGSDTRERPLRLELADGRAEPIEEVAAEDGAASLRFPAQPGHYMLRVDSRDEQKRPLAYELTAYFEAEPPPPPPPPPPPKPVAQFRVVEGAVLEVEGEGGEPRAVLIDRGEQEGIAAGQRGRLLEGDQTIGSVVVEQSYPEGSRVRIDGALGAPITAHTRAEIDVPIAGRK